VVLAVLAVGNGVFHFEVIVRGVADYGIRIGIGAIISLIMLIGGRIVPSFTPKLLARQGSAPFPPAVSPPDTLPPAFAAIALVAWIFRPVSPVVGALLMGAGLVHFVRLARWAGERTLADRLVLILHVGYAFVPIGFLLTGMAALFPELVPTSAGIHA